MLTKIHRLYNSFLFFFSTVLLCKGFERHEYHCRGSRRNHHVASNTALLATRLIHLDSIDRVYCISDLHTDHVDNMKWLKRKVSKSDLSMNDLVIIAGDISHDMVTFEESIQTLRDRCQVLFVPGNHEAWVARSDNCDSIGKLDAIYNTCRRYNVLVDPLYLSGPHPLWIVPLQGWYDGSLSFSEELCEGFNNWPWADFVRCEWPLNFPALPDHDVNAGIPLGLVGYFLELNKVNLAQIPISEHEQPYSILSVSHFLPNQQCLPDWVSLDSSSFDMNWLNHGAGTVSAKFAKVAGSLLLDQQIRSLISPMRHIHVFGHSHRPKDFVFNGIRYIHNPLGKPRERQMYMISPLVNLQLVWDRHLGEVAAETIIRFWDQKGGGTKALNERLERIRPGRYRQR